MEKLKHYAFTGTHSTGKTTVLDALYNTKYKIFKSITRTKGNGKINKECTSESQLHLINETVNYYKDVEKVNSLEDRCFIDTYAYNLYFHKKQLIDDETLMYCYNEFVNYINFHNHIFYFKAEFKNVIDDVRIDDEDFRVSVEENIEKILETYYKDRYTTISGTVEERVKIIKKCILDVYE